MIIEFLKDYRGKLTKERPHKKGQIVDCSINPFVFGDVLVERGYACVAGSKPKPEPVIEKVMDADYNWEEVEKPVEKVVEKKVVKKKVAKKKPAKKKVKK